MKIAVADLLLQASGKKPRGRLQKRDSVVAGLAGDVTSSVNAPKAGVRRSTMGASKADRRLRRMAEKAEPGKCHTLEEIASVMGITRERVRQIEMKALRTMRNRLSIIIGSEDVTPSDLLAALAAAKEM